MSEPVPLEPAVFKEALIVLGATAAVIPVFYRLRVSPVVGFILTGMILGPFGLGALTGVAPWLDHITISNRDAIEPVAQWGVVLLLFMIGLELSFERLRLMSRLVFGLGALQLVLCTAGIAAILMLIGIPTVPALLLGVALAQSSTAVLIQVLAEEKKLTAPVGRASFAILLFQDISVAPILFGVAVLAASGSGDAVLGAFGLATVAAALALVAIIAVGRLAVRPLFRSVARTQSPELFLAACLLIIIAAALAASGAGLSAATGALVAGILLAETEYRRQIEVLIEPFKGLFLGVFLISAGMSIDLSVAASQPVLVFGGAIGLILVKAAIIFGLARLFKLQQHTAIGAALLLAPGGEFAFIILGATAGLVGASEMETALIIAALTMISIPFMSKLSDALGKRLKKDKAISEEMLLPEKLEGAPRVVVAGYGRVGGVVASMLEEHNVPYIALDTDPDLVTAARRAGKPVYYGDASNPLMLERVGLATMRALIATMDSPERIEAVVAAGRKARADLLIVARARDARHAARLYKLGASDVAPETIEASLQLSETVLVDLGVPMGPVIASIHDKRAQFRAEVQKLAPEMEIPVRSRRRLRERLGKGSREQEAADRGE
jgi:CPA2 family monovalent cation:H+ antiporter-2